MTLKKTPDRKGISSFTIIKILKTFSSKELIEFEKLLTSPYFNNHTTVIKLFCELKKQYPNFKDEGLSKENLFEAVNKGKKYDDMLFQKYLSRLNKLAEEYLNLIEMRKELNNKEVNVIHQLSKRNLKDVYSRKLNEFEKTLDNDTKINEEYYFIKHKLSTIKYNHKSRDNYSHLYKKELLDSYNNLINYFVLNAGFFINQLSSDRFSYIIPEELNIKGTFYEKSEMIKNLNFLIGSTPASNKKRLLFLDLILYDLKMIPGKKGRSAYNNLKELVFSNSDVLSEELLLFYTKRMNVYCIIETSTGVQDMKKELFDNYKFLLENRLFCLEETPDLGILDYRAILFNALKINEIEWSEKFLIEYKDQIKEDFRENFFNFGYSMLLFYKRNYSGALDHISMIRNEPLPVTLDIYILKIKLFYELGFIDSALSLADSFRHFLLNSKLISEHLVSNHITFIKYFKLIARLKMKSDKNKLNNLLSDLKNTGKVRDKDWLLVKTDELTGSKKNEIL